MIKALALFAILCGLLLVFGGESDAGKHRMDLRAYSEKRIVTISVYLPDITDAYRWLSVYGCSAEVTENGTACTYFFERESSMELAGRKQSVVFWRDLPRGTMLVTAIAFDVGHAPLARAQTVIFRGE